MTLGPYNVHPFADVFPLIEGDEFKTLVEDIKRNGLRETIKLSPDGDTIVDGRNRYRACIEGTVDARFERLSDFYTDQMIADYILSKNVERRHLNAGQKAGISLTYEKMYGEEAKERQAKGRPVQPKREELPAVRREQRERESSELAANRTGASGRNVQRAKKVDTAAPDLMLKVMAGTVALDAAYKEVQASERAKPKLENEKPSPTILELRTHDGQVVPYPKPQSKAVFNKTSGEGISWAGWSWNPVTGCLHGCSYCYARELAIRESYAAAYPVGFTPLFHSERLDAPANTKIPDDTDEKMRRVFVCSMADLYGKWVPIEWINEVHAVCIANPQWQYLMLTKFPKRYVGLDLPKTAWLGTSVDEQKRVRLAEEAFREIGGVAVKWLSLEPLNADLQFADLSMFDWVVIGAQTETMQPTGRVPAIAPPFEWVARIVAQAREAGCRIHLKPNLLGAVSPQLPGMTLLNEYPVPRLANFSGTEKHGDIAKASGMPAGSLTNYLRAL